MGPNIHIFCENWHEASFYIKKQMYNFFLHLSFKNYYLDPPPKVRFMVFEEKPTKKVFYHQKRNFGRFGRLLTVFCAF